MSGLPDYTAQWFSQRESGARAVAAIERDELRALTDDEALRLADALLAATPTQTTDATRRSTSGLVEQQRLFARARR